MSTCGERGLIRERLQGREAILLPFSKAAREITRLVAVHAHLQLHASQTFCGYGGMSGTSIANRSLASPTLLFVGIEASVKFVRYENESQVLGSVV